MPDSFLRDRPPDFFTRPFGRVFFSAPAWQRITGRHRPVLISQVNDEWQELDP